MPKKVVKKKALSSDGTVTIAGVVHARGVSGGKTPEEADWGLSFALEPWRGSDGVLQSAELRIHRKVTTTELEELQERIQPYDVLKFRVRWSEPAKAAELVEIIGPADGDGDLAQRAAELQQPDKIEDDVFGTLVFDRGLDWYEVKADWCKTPILLHVCLGADRTLESPLQTAKTLWQERESWDLRICEYTVQKLLGLKNSTWLEEGEDELTAEQFKSYLLLESVTAYANGRFEFFFEDGELFWGHTIEVSGSLVDGPDDAHLGG